MIPYTQIRIYEDIGSEFVYDQELCDAINVELPEDATAEQVKEIIARKVIYGETRMRWSNEMFYILLLNSFAGAIAYGFWMIAKSGMAKRKKLKYVYPMLGIVEAFFIFPIMYSYLENFNPCSGKSLEHIMEHYFCAHRLFTMCSV